MTDKVDKLPCTYHLHATRIAACHPMYILPNASRKLQGTETACQAVLAMRLPFYLMHGPQ